MIRDLEKRPENLQLLQIDNLSNEGMNVVLQIVSDVRYVHCLLSLRNFILHKSTYF